MGSDIFELQKVDVLKRWRPIDKSLLPPFLFPPAHVRILMYAEGGIQFTGGSFHGLTHVLATLAADPWFWVKFDVTKANRGADPSADRQNVKLTDFTLSASFDEIWLFGFNSGDLLTPQEKAALADFMDNHKGGVLATGDHASLGQGIAGAVPRAGKMRLYPAPPNMGPGWNTTIVEGSDPNSTYDFDDQSDDVPQRIRWKKYPLWSLISTPFSRRVRPHPLLCSPEGPIDVFPDHEHEGEAIVPSTFPAAEWPSGPTGQVRPEVIAWGRIKDPVATKTGQEIGLVSAYDGHEASVGRIAADSTWHHFFDINLNGLPGDPTYRGFSATPGGQAALKKIEAYYLNLAVWLAPPSKQAQMRSAASWYTLWTDRFAELATSEVLLKDSVISHLIIGEQAIDALGRVAPVCTVHQWLYVDLLREIDPHILVRARELLEHDPVVPHLLGHFAVGAAVSELMRQFGPGAHGAALPKGPPDADAFHRTLVTSAARGFASTQDYFSGLANSVGRLVGKAC
jgi:hypothetical protein